MVSKSTMVETRWWKNSTSIAIVTNAMLSLLVVPKSMLSPSFYIIISFFLLHPLLLDVCIFFQSIQQTTDRASKSDLSGHQKSLSGSFRYLLSTAEFLCHPRVCMYTYIYLYVDTHGKSAVGHSYEYTPQHLLA